MRRDLKGRSVCEEKWVEKWKRRENRVGGLGREIGKMRNSYRGAWEGIPNIFERWRNS